MIKFFITGFPRSRLAWIANYLYYGNMACIHDGLFYGLESEDFGFLNNFHNAAEVVGLADSALAVYQNALIEKYPEAKSQWVIIERPFNQVRDSIKALGVDPGNRLANLAGKMEELRARVDPLRIKFNTLDDSIRDLARYVNPEWNCPVQRHEMLLKMNLQMNPDLGKKLLATIPKDNLLQRRAEPANPTALNRAALELLYKMCENCPLAFTFLNQAIEAALVWDHVKDGDPIDYDSTDRVFEALLTEWPNNDFVRDNAKALTPVMAGAIAKWKFGQTRAEHFAVYEDLASAVAFILGGMNYVNAYMPVFKSLFSASIKEDDLRDAA